MVLGRVDKTPPSLQTDPMVDIEMDDRQVRSRPTICVVHRIIAVCSDTNPTDPATSRSTRCLDTQLPVSWLLSQTIRYFGESLSGHPLPRTSPPPFPSATPLPRTDSDRFKPSHTGEEVHEKKGEIIGLQGFFSHKPFDLENKIGDVIGHTERGDCRATAPPPDPNPPPLTRHLG